MPHSDQPRATASLDGIWQARLDPNDVGLAEAWAAPDMPFDRELPVPLPWQAADPALRRYAGVVWYRRTFDIPAGWHGGSLALRFGAVDYAATIWVNGHEVGRHEGGYTPFVVELGDRAPRRGPNTLTVRVFDPPGLDELPHGKQGGRWYSPVSGLWQSVSLISRPAERVLTPRCHPDAVRGVVRVAATCRVGAGAYRLLLEVLESGGERPVAGASALVSEDTPTALVELRLPQPRLWEPKTPHLYVLRATLRAPGGETLDVLEEPFGLRTVEARGGELFLNGRPLYLRGALDQAYWPDSLYTAPSDAEIEREIRLAKEMGLNLLRKHIKPEDPRYLDAADRLGLLIWAEPATTVGFTPAARAALRRDLLEMIDRDFNRPSVVVWSLYNEDWGLPDLWSDVEKQAWLAELYREVKALDPTRLVCDDSGWAHVVTDLNDYHEYYAAPERIAAFGRRLDFIAAHPGDNFAHGHTPVGEPMLISEFGNWALPDPRDARDRSGGADPPWFHYDRAYTRPAGQGPPRPENPLTERVKTIAGFEDRFRNLGLAEVFGSTEALTQHLQHRAFRALKAQIEEMRRRPELRGYVVTEFSDIEWEANGWLDYWRRPKAFHPDLADVNADLALIATPERPNAWGGQTVVVRLHLANTTPRPLHGAVRWRLEGTELAGEVPATVGAHETVCAATAVTFRAPDDRPRPARLELELVEGAEIRARTYAELAFAPRLAGLVDGIGANGHTLDRVFRQRLERQGFRIPRGFTPDLPIAIANRLDEQVWEYAVTGGRVLYLASTSSEGAALAGLRFNALRPAESWRMAAGAAWARADRLAPAPILAELGWEVAEIFPLQAIDAGVLRPGDEQLAGWFEGWLANPGVFMLARSVGRGRLLATTFRFEETYGLDPVPTTLLNRLVGILLEP
jgi:hypothetical protein